MSPSKKRIAPGTNLHMPSSLPSTNSEGEEQFDLERAPSAAGISAVATKASDSVADDRWFNQLPSLDNEDLIHGGDGEEAGTLSNYQSNSPWLWLDSRNWYFLLLRTPATTLAIMFIVIYALVSAVIAVVHIPFSSLLDQEAMPGYSQPAKVFLFVFSNILTSSFLFDIDNLPIGWILSGFAQQIVGILLNVILFGVIATKLQSPYATMIFSDVAIFSQRDGKRCLQLRIGNLRTNLVMHPEVQLCLMKRHVTPEGEDFMSYHELEISNPSTLSACSTIVHYITEDSPLYGLTRDYIESLDSSELQIIATIIGTDSVFLADVTSMHRYKPIDILFNKTFAPVMRVANEGQAYVDFSAFSDVRDIDTRLLDLNGDVARPDVSPGDSTIHLCVGSFREFKIEYLLKSCVFCQRIHWLLALADGIMLKQDGEGIDMKIYCIDLLDKPEWFLDASNGNGKTPLCYVKVGQGERELKRKRDLAQKQSGGNDRQRITCVCGVCRCVWGGGGGGIRIYVYPLATHTSPQSKWYEDSHEIYKVLADEYPAVNELYGKGGIGDAGITGNDMCKQLFRVMRWEPGTKAQQSRAMKLCLKQLKALNDYLLFDTGPYLKGETISIADIDMLPMLWQTCVALECWYGIDARQKYPSLDIYLTRAESLDSWKLSRPDEVATMLYLLHRARQDPKTKLSEKSLAKMKEKAKALVKEKSKATHCL